MSEAKRSSLPGTGIDPELIANSILRRAFKEKIAVSPMKLQKLMFFITCLYQRNTGHRLLTESFQPWQYGPVCGAVYGEFKSFGGNPITEYAKDAMGNAYAPAAVVEPVAAGTAVDSDCCWSLDSLFFSGDHAVTPSYPHEQSLGGIHCIHTPES